MPPQHGLGLDDQERVLPALELAREHDEQQAIGAGEVRAFDRAVEDDELLTQQEVLSNQLRFAASEVSDGAKRRRVRDGLSQARAGAAGGLQPPVDDRLDPLLDPDHLLPPSCSFDTTLMSRGREV